MAIVFGLENPRDVFLVLPLPGHPPLSDQAQVLLLVLLSHLYKSLSVLDKDKEKVNFERFRIKKK